MKFRKKPVIVDAMQWNKSHAGVCGGAVGVQHPAVESYFNKFPSLPGYFVCKHCGADDRSHGSIRTIKGNLVVCPGDWIVTETKGEHYPCKPDIFKATYEAVGEGEG